MAIAKETTEHLTAAAAQASIADTAKEHVKKHAGKKLEAGAKKVLGKFLKVC